jgi:SPP1 family predicted phage head-tail adaptor
MRYQAPPLVETGDLSELISIEVETRTNDGYGGFTQSWTQFCQAWAHPVPLYVGESSANGALRGPTNYQFWIYRRTDITETMRIVWNGRIFNIRGVKVPPSTKQMMDIVAEAGVTQ